MKYWTRYSFRFEPKRLAEVTLRMREELPDGPTEWKPSRSQSVDFDVLLQRLRVASEEQLDDLVQDLSTAELDTLCYRYAEINAKDPAKRNATKALLRRWKRRFGSAVWRQYQQSFRDPGLPRLIAEALTRGDVPNLHEAVSTNLNAVFQSEDPVRGLVAVFLERNESFGTVARWLAIREGSPLELELTRRYMLSASAEIYSKPENLEFLRNGLDLMRREFPLDYPRFTDHYLTVMPLDAFQGLVLTHILNTLGRPDDANRHWVSISKESQEKFLAWLGWQAALKFFEEAGDHERIRFWEQFKTALRDARRTSVRATGVLFLVFDSVVVVEFLQTGNAAYIYDRTHYEREFKKYAIGQVAVTHESWLKDLVHCLERIVHGGRWQERVYERVRTLITRGAVSA